MEQVYEVWIEIQANKKLILNREEFKSVIMKCKELGMTGAILSVKDTTGFVLYKSDLAYHYSCYDDDFKTDVDYAATCFQIIKEAGLKCYAALDVFVEGNKNKPNPYMKGFKHGWECEVYGLDENDKAVIRKSTQSENIQTVGSIDDFGEIFVNPGNPEICKYELELIEEVISRYHPDGIVLDRVRYVGLSADFSEQAKKGWEEYSGISDENWPTDIYEIRKLENSLREIPGKYFGSFFEYRASQIKTFIEEAGSLIHQKFPGTEFCDYTGSWYPLYYKVGANWASEKYESTEFPWCDSKQLMKTGYAEIPNRLMSGFYYEDVWVSEAIKHGKPEEWYSVEGAYDLASQVTNQKKGLIGSLYIEQYKDFPERLIDAVTLCLEKTSGCMIFDLSYIMEYNWWKYMKKVNIESLEEKDMEELFCLCKNVFRSEYHITKEKIEQNLFKDKDFSFSESKKICDVKNGKVLGFIGVKISTNREIYPDIAWISILAVDEQEQKKGYGRLLVNRVYQSLKKLGIKKIYIGQDFNNFFSGIPDPNGEKREFFRDLEFTLNTEEHFDLEADIKQNDDIDRFNVKSFVKEYTTNIYEDNKEELLDFLEREFPGRWVYEAEEAIKSEKNPSEILILWNKEKTEVLGYCMLSVDINGYGGLGPIGIAKKIRGNHVGDYILYESLQQLRRIGAVRVNIDWTILKDFYGQFAFKPDRTYLAAYREMNE